MNCSPSWHSDDGSITEAMLLNQHHLQMLYTPSDAILLVNAVSLIVSHLCHSLSPNLTQRHVSNGLERKFASRLFVSEVRPQNLWKKLAKKNFCCSQLVFISILCLF